jgi:membrane-bound serine protease (ClpP class)
MKQASLLALAMILLVLAGEPCALAADLEPGVVGVITIDGPIGVVTARFFQQALEACTEADAAAMLVKLNTPGGLVEATDTILEQELNAAVPVIVYVHPEGARAASAGTFITLAAHVAAMSPATNIGAAHPVSLTGGGIGPGKERSKRGPDEDSGSGEAGGAEAPPSRSEDSGDIMGEKILNDMVARIRTIAQRRGRNADWAERAVRESISSTEEEALELGVIDLVAADVEELLAALDGRTVRTREGERTLKLAGAPLRPIEMNWRLRVLDAISDPNIAYLLLSFGVLGLYVEFLHPGAMFPGIAGGLCLILALFALHTLPINIAGLLLIIGAFVLFILEFKVVSFGLLTMGGVVALFLGSLMLIDSPLPYMRVSLTVIVPIVIVISSIAAFLMWLVIRVHRERAATGTSGMIGLEGEVLRRIDPQGEVFVHGERWRARASQPIDRGQRVRVVAVDGLLLHVEPTSPETHTGREEESS